MKVYVCFREFINPDTNCEEVELKAIFSKEDYADQYCEQYSTKSIIYWYEPRLVDAKLEELN